MAPGTIYCCIPSCVSSRSRALVNTVVIQDNSEAITFHRFPKNPERYSLWVEKCFGANCSDDWLDVISGKKLLSICSKHFTDDDFTQTYAFGDLLQYTKKRYLKVNAVPSVDLKFQSVQESKGPKVPIIGQSRPKPVLLTPSPKKIEIPPRIFNNLPGADKNNSISEKLRQLREEGRRRIVQLIKENEEIYKCPIHKVNSPTCSIEKCVLRNRRRPKFEEPSLEDGSSTAHNLDFHDSNEYNEESTCSMPDEIDIKEEVFIQEEIPSPGSYDTPKNLDFVQVDSGQNVVLNFVANSCPPGHSLPSTISIPQHLLSKNPSIHFDEVGNYSFSTGDKPFDESSSAPISDSINVVGKIGRKIAPKPARKTGIQRQAGVERSGGSSEAGTVVESTELEESEKQRLEEFKSDSSAVWVAKVDKEGAVTGLEKLEKLQKIKKIDRLISENNLLISKLPIVDSSKLAGLKRKSGLGGGGSEKLRRCYAVEEDEEVQVTNKENTNQPPPLVPLRSSCQNQVSSPEAKILEQSSLIQQLLDRALKLEGDNRKLAEEKRELLNEHRKVIEENRKLVEENRRLTAGQKESKHRKRRASKLRLREENCDNATEVCDITTPSENSADSGEHFEQRTKIVPEDSETISKNILDIADSRSCKVKSAIERRPSGNSVQRTRCKSDKTSESLVVEYLDENSVSDEGYSIEESEQLSAENSAQIIGAVDSEGNSVEYISAKDLQEYVVIQSYTRDGHTEVKVMRNDDYAKLSQSGQFQIVENSRGDSGDEE